MAFRYLSVRSSAQSHGRDRPHPPQRICTSKHAKAQTPQCVRHSSLHRPVPSPPLPSLLLPPLPIDLAFSFPNGGPRYNNCRKQWRSQDLHMEGVGRAKRDRHGRRRRRRRRPCWGWVREGVAPSRKGGSGVSPPRKF
jgi:hypothetical protein